MEPIYLDNAASVKPVRSIIDAVMPYIKSDWHNPSSKYSKGLNVKEKIESVRANIAKEICVSADEIYFTSGATESNNWAIQGYVMQCNRDSILPVVITTDIEHNSIRECVKNISKNIECYVHFIPVNKDGFIDIDKLKELLNYYTDKNAFQNYRKPIKLLVSVGMGNNEIGTIQEIASIADIVHAYNGILHTDATQCFGHIPINNQILCTDMISASAQKLGGLKGTGFLYKKNSIEIQPLIYGSQERGQRGGTENVVGIIALGEAIKQIDYSKANNVKYLRDYMIKKLSERLGCRINGSITDRLPNNINITFPQSVTGEALIYLLDMCNIYISSGSACNAYSENISHVLCAIGLDDYKISKSIRITLPDDINIEQIDKVVNEIEKQIQVLTS